MKLGIENRKRVIALAVVMLLAAAIWVRMISGSAAPVPAAVAATVKAAAKKTSNRSRRTHRMVAKPTVLVSPLDPTLQFQWLKASEEREYEGGKRNIFQEQEEVDIPHPDGDGTTGHPKDPGPPPPPPIQPPPAINLKFYGYASKAGEKKRVFLSSGEDIFIGSEGEIINRRYKILRITGNGVEVEDILNNNRQMIPLTAS